MPQLRDVTDEILAELKRIRQALSNERDPSTDESNAPQSPVFSTGASPLTPTTEWQEITFGFIASEVAVRHTDNVVIAYEKPQDRPGVQISLRGNGAFTLGGQPPLRTGNVWVRKADDATADPEVTVVAY